MLAADSGPLNDYFQGEFWPADEPGLQTSASSMKRKPDDAWGLPWGQPAGEGKRAKDDDLHAAAAGGSGRGGAAAAAAGGDEDRQQQLLNERRARNRRHARETRRRKKESLHDMLAELEKLRALKARHEGSLEAARGEHACRRLTRGLELVLALRAQAGHGAEPAGAAATRWQAAVAPGAVLVAPLAPYRFSAPPTSQGVAAAPSEHSGCQGVGAARLTFAAAPLDDLAGPTTPGGDGAHAACASTGSASGVQAFMAEAAGLAACVAALTGRGLHEDAATRAHWQALSPYGVAAAETAGETAAETASGGGGSLDGGYGLGGDRPRRGPPPPKPPKPSGALGGDKVAKPASPLRLASTGIASLPSGAACVPACAPASPSSVTHLLNPTASSSDEEHDDLALAKPGSSSSNAPGALAAPAHALSLPLLAPPPARRTGPAGVQLAHVLVGEACLGRGGRSVAAPFELWSTNLVQDFGCRAEVCERGSVVAEFEPNHTPGAHRPLSALDDDGEEGSEGSEGGEGAAPPLKLVRLELCYDVVSFWRQLQAARGGGPLAVQPSTLADARRSLAPPRSPTAGGAAAGAALLPPVPEPLARAVVSALPPHAVEEANAAWCALAGGSEGGSGPGADPHALGRLLGLHPAAASAPTSPPADLGLSAAARFAADLAAGRPSSLGWALQRHGVEAVTTAAAATTFAVVEAAPLVSGGGGAVTHFLLTLRATAATV